MDQSPSVSVNGGLARHSAVIERSPTDVSAKIAASRSISVTSMNSEGSSMQDLATVMDQEGIVTLTRDVRTFKETLGKLKRIFSADKEKLEKSRVAAHESLGEVLRILQGILLKQPKLKSTELLVAAESIIKQVKDYRFEDDKANPSEFLESVDQLALAFSSCYYGYDIIVLAHRFPQSPKLSSVELSQHLNGWLSRAARRRSSREVVILDGLANGPNSLSLIAESKSSGGPKTVSEFLMGDLDSSNQAASKTRSCDNLLAADIDGTDSCQGQTMLTAGEIDAVMMKSPQGVEVALHHAKMWSKYAKDLASYIEKHSSLEAEHARSLVKLVHTMRPILKEEAFMPFQSIYCTALDQDVEYANTILATCNLLQSHKYIEPLMARRNEHERIRKQLKDTWHRELKRMQEAVSNLRKSKALYIQRQQDYEKAKESLQKVESSSQGMDLTDSSKIDRKRKLKEDNLQKALEAETTYKACVMEANERQQQLEKVKSEVLKQVRELIYQCDQTMKAVTVSYFQLQHTVTAPAPVQFQTLCESSRLYEPGLQYMERVKRQPFSSLHHSFSMSAVTQDRSSSPSFVFEPFNSERLLEKARQSNDSGADCDEGQTEVSKTRLSAPNKSWSGNFSANGSDSDSIESTGNRSRDPSPTASPQISSHDNKIPYGINMSSGDELEHDLEPVSSNVTRRQTMSKAAVTHAFRKLKTPSRCRECDSYVYFQGAECTECGLSCHKKCLESLAIQCGHKRLPRKMTTFGVELATHLLSTNTGVPPIVTKCISEVEERGIDMKGIYRVSGVKSKVEKLCQTFESGMELVDASEVRPCVIANVLKLYLRQLPEPLLTYRLYKDFIAVTKLLPDNSAIIEELKKLVHLLPIPYYKTLAYLMHHLKRVSDLNELNNMPSSNLGIVFGPTLLRTSEGSASLSSLVDTVHQAKIIELLIDNVVEIFGPENKYESQRNKRSNETECDKTVEDDEKKIRRECNKDNADHKSLSGDNLHSFSDEWKDLTAEFDEDLPDSYQEDSIDSPTLKHPAFTRQSAARVEHRRFRHISEGYTLSELSKESSIQHKAIIQRRKIYKSNSNNLKDEESEDSGAKLPVNEKPSDDTFETNIVSEHTKLQKVANYQTSSPIAAQNAQLRSKFFGATNQDEKFQSGLTKSYSASSVSSNCNIDETPFLSSRITNRFGKGPIYLPKTCLVPDEEIIIPQRITYQSRLDGIKQKYETEERAFASRYSVSTNEHSKSSNFSYGPKSPDPLASPFNSGDLLYPQPVTTSNSESDISNGHRALHRTSESNQARGSSSESLSSERSSRHLLKSKYHLPLNKTKSSGSSDGYNEDEELMMENEVHNSSPSAEQNDDLHLTFV